ncbi:MAG: sigma-70 family RNA polymerase sigma factor [Bernardetiaceae bacterium]|nr:sigma-70 family RNA polymerase sigma factor [Bernardetiaceae bacterium]
MNKEKKLKIDEAHIVQKIKAGDKNVLDAFYLDERHNFIRWANKKYNIEHEILIDVYQNAFIAMYEKIIDGQLDNLSCRLSTFLFGIGKNMLYKKWKKEEVKYRHEATVKEQQLFLKEDTQDEDERSEAIRQVLQDFKEPCRSILIRFYYEGQDIAQIAEEMRYKNKNVVKSQKVRCLKKLSEMLKLKLAQNDL